MATDFALDSSKRFLASRTLFLQELRWATCHTNNVHTLASGNQYPISRLSFENRLTPTCQKLGAGCRLAQERQEIKADTTCRRIAAKIPHKSHPGAGACGLYANGAGNCRARSKDIVITLCVMLCAVWRRDSIEMRVKSVSSEYCTASQNAECTPPSVIFRHADPLSNLSLPRWASEGVGLSGGRRGRSLNLEHAM